MSFRLVENLIVIMKFPYEVPFLNGLGSLIPLVKGVRGMFLSYES